MKWKRIKAGRYESECGRYRIEKSSQDRFWDGYACAYETTTGEDLRVGWGSYLSVVKEEVEAFERAEIRLRANRAKEGPCPEKSCAGEIALVEGYGYRCLAGCGHPAKAA
jgi:hypothetical protein